MFSFWSWVVSMSEVRIDVRRFWVRRPFPLLPPGLPLGSLPVRQRCRFASGPLTPGRRLSHASVPRPRRFAAPFFPPAVYPKETQDLITQVARPLPHAQKPTEEWTGVDESTPDPETIPPKRLETSKAQSPSLVLLVLIATVGIIAYTGFLLNPASRGDWLPYSMVIIAELVLISQDRKSVV